MIELDADSIDLMNELDRQNAEYILVGAHALAAHGVIRATSDVDILVRPTVANANAVYLALANFGAPLVAHGLDARYFSEKDRVYQIGLPPRRIDLLSSISGVTADEAFQTAIKVSVGGTQRNVLSIDALLKNKRATGRLKDQSDVERLEAVSSKKTPQ